MPEEKPCYFCGLPAWDHEGELSYRERGAGGGLVETAYLVHWSCAEVARRFIRGLEQEAPKTRAAGGGDAG